MINIIMSANGQGKTLYVEDILVKSIESSKVVVSNIPNSLTSSKIDKDKANILTSNTRLTYTVLNNTSIRG